MKIACALALAAALLASMSGYSAADQRTAWLPNACTAQACTSPLLHPVQSESPRCKAQLQTCRAKCSGPTRGNCLSKCGEQYENCN